MKWYEWVFDGLGTAIIGALCSWISYKAAIKKLNGEQSQKAGDNARQTQEINIVSERSNENVQSTIRQTQDAGDNAEQIQRGGFKSGK